jgi:hypothetical protein
MIIHFSSPFAYLAVLVKDFTDRFNPVRRGMMAPRCLKTFLIAVLAPAPRLAYLIQLPKTQFLIPSPEKMTLILVFCQGLGSPDGIK